MFKKLVIVSGVLLLGGWLWAKTDLGSYVRTAWTELRGTVKNSVPTEFEIKRAKEMLVNIDKEVDKVITVMAEQKFVIDREERAVADRSVWLDKERQAIKAMNEGLKSGKAILVSSLGEVSRERFGRDLDRRFKRFTMHEEALKNKKDSLVNNKEFLTAAREQLDTLRAQRADLHARIEKLETQLQIVKAAETRTKNACTFDDSELAKVKALVDSIEETIEKRLFHAKMQEEYQPAATTQPEISADLTVTIDAHFGGPAIVEAKDKAVEEKKDNKSVASEK